MRKKLTLKATAMILTVSMFISGIPFNAFVSSAQEMEPEPKSDGNEIVCEIVEQRNRYSKTFMRADDTYVAVISGQALHYEDSEGNWQDIDNTLEMETNDNDEEVVTNKANDLSVEFPKTLDNDKQVTIEKSGYSISFKLLDTLKKSKSNIKNNKKQKQDKKQANTQIKEEEKSSAISYSNVMQDTDIVYDIKPQEVKESIVLSKKPKKDAVYTYRVTVPGLTAKLRDDNSIEFCAKGNADPEFIMPSPYMFDSAEAYSHDIAVTLKQETDGVYTMSYMPSNKWLKDKAREYPVTIDPTVITDKVKKNIQDTRIKKNLPNAVLGGMNTIYATSSADSAGESHALVKFNELIDVGFITKASLCLVGARNYSDPLSLRIHRITGVWDENTANYNNINSLISSEAEDDIYLENPPAYDAIYRFDITRMYHDWMVNGNNYGVAIKNSGAGNPTAEWFSSDRTETTRYPYVEIEYQTGSAMDTSYDNHQFDVGRAGTLYVNDFSGDFTLSRREMGFDGNIMPVNISMLYSPLNYSNSSRVWKTNYEWRLYYGAFRCTLIDENNVSVYLNRISTEAGKPLVFWENISQGEDGEEYSGYKLEVDGSSRKLTAPDGRVLDFSVYYNENYPYFYLPSSITKDEASVKLTWEKDKLIQILDGVNRKYVINYDTKARISAINYYGTGTSILNTVSYVYDSNNNMTSAVYPDGKSVKYAYELAKSGDSYQLKSITDTDGYSLKLSYGTGTLARLNKIEEFASDGTAGNKVEITYRAYNTTFADSTGKKEIKQFNQYGQTTCTRDENGYAVFSTYSGSGKGEFMGSSDVQIPGENNLYDMDGAFVSAIGTERYIKDVPYEGGTPNWSRKIYPSRQIGSTYWTWNHLTQHIKVDAKKDEVYSYGGWAKAVAMPILESVVPGRSFGMEVNIRDKVTGKVETIDKFDFDSNNADWQYMKSSFTLPYDVSQISVTFNYYYQTNPAYLFGVELQKQPLYYYSTDQNGDIVKQEGEETKEEGLISINRSQSSEDEKGRTKESISAEGVGSTYSYDKYGNLISQVTTNGRVKMESKNIYSSNGDYLESTVDALGNSTAYQYDASLGTLKNMTDAKGTTTNYTYDNLQRLAGISTTASSSGNSSYTLRNSYTYEYDRLKTIANNNGVTYTFGYDKWGQQSSIKIGNQSLLTNKYLNNITRLLDTVTYGNGQSLNYFYNSKDQLSGLRFNGDSADRFSYTYDKYGKLTEMRDTVNNTLTKYKDELIEEYTLDGSTLKHSYVSDSGKFIEKLNNKTLTTNYKSDKDGRPVSTSYEYATGKKASTEIRYDDLGRVTNKGAYVTENGTDKPVYMSSYLYRELAGFKSSEQVAGVSYSYGNGNAQTDNTLSYTYDKTGNILSISKGGSSFKSYEYDTVGQLVRANEVDTGKTTTYRYDNGGNITVKTEYDYTTGALGTVRNTINYGYTDSNWKDKLTSYNGKPITYDEIGNPTSYDGWTYVWEGGRQLKRMTKNGSTMDYKYNANGIRTSKTVNGVTTNYTLVGDRITAQETNGSWTYFRYDENNELISLNWNGSEYVYVRNIQNDIIGLVDDSGKLVVEYAYDVWGKAISTTGSLAGTLGAANPFRYRGYYFDTETGLYYLQSRYYDAEIGRFINADTPESMLLQPENVLSTNLFAYCNNNPVMFSDSTGYIAANVVGAIVGGVLGAVGGAFLGNWLADKIGLKGWKRWLFVGAVSVLVGAAAAAIGYVVGPYIAKAWNYIGAKLAGLVKGTFKSIAKITTKKMSKINVSKHLWSKVLGKKVTNTNIQNLIFKTIRKGTWKYQTDGIIRIVLKQGNHYVVVTGKVINKVFNISDSWVWNGIGKLWGSAV